MFNDQYAIWPTHLEAMKHIIFTIYVEKKYILCANHLKAIQHIFTIPLDVCNIIIKYSINKSYINYSMIFASEHGHLEIVKFLHTNGADINYFDNFAVRYASANNHLKTVRYLHTNGADFFKKSLQNSF